MESTFIQYILMAQTTLHKDIIKLKYQRVKLMIDGSIKPESLTLLHKISESSWGFDSNEGPLRLKVETKAKF